MSLHHVSLIPCVILMVLKCYLVPYHMSRRKQKCSQFVMLMIVKQVCMYLHQGHPCLYMNPNNQSLSTYSLLILVNSKVLMHVLVLDGVN